ncbi:hypothetical protein BJ546DRAFT_948496 [Cryomyces antarcticus]
MEERGESSETTQRERGGGKKGKKHTPSDLWGPKSYYHWETLSSFEASLCHHIDNRVVNISPGGVETCELTFKPRSVFIIAHPPEAPAASPSQSGDVQTIRDESSEFDKIKFSISVSEVLAIQDMSDRLKKQREIAKALVDVAQRVDGFKYSFGNNWNAKDEDGFRFSYQCNDSLQNKDRQTNGLRLNAKAPYHGYGVRGTFRSTRQSLKEKRTALAEAVEECEQTVTGVDYHSPIFVQLPHGPQRLEALRRVLPVEKRAKVQEPERTVVKVDYRSTFYTESPFFTACPSLTNLDTRMTGFVPYTKTKEHKRQKEMLESRLVADRPTTVNHAANSPNPSGNESLADLLRASAYGSVTAPFSPPAYCITSIYNPEVTYAPVRNEIVGGARVVGEARPVAGVRHKRSNHTCDFCHARRTKCGEERPSCRSCAHNGRLCTYPDQDGSWFQERSNVNRKGLRPPPLPKLRTSCITCRERKKKCDNAQPVCGQCSADSQTCAYKPYQVQLQYERSAPYDSRTVPQQSIRTGTGNVSAHSSTQVADSETSAPVGQCTDSSGGSARTVEDDLYVMTPEYLRAANGAFRSSIPTMPFGRIEPPANIMDRPYSWR